jgi:hypothetical protein
VTKRPMPEINPAKIRFIIEESREYLSEDVGVDPDASNPSDDDERIMLTHASDRPTRRELVEFIKDLDVDEAPALVALAWIGRADYDADHWQSAVGAARERQEGPTWRCLFGISLLPDNLEDALSGFGRSCEDFEASQEG